MNVIARVSQRQPSQHLIGARDKYGMNHREQRGITRILKRLRIDSPWETDSCGSRV